MTADARAAHVVGAGDATGGAVARCFAREGYGACVTRSHPDKLQPPVDGIHASGARHARRAARHGVPFASNPHFPINTLTLMHGATGLQIRQPEVFMRYVDAVFDAMWLHPCNLGDAGGLAAVLTLAGLEVDAFTSLTADPAVKVALVAQTEQAVACGVFGAPTCFVGDEMFSGQDRLAFVREAAED